MSDKNLTRALDDIKQLEAQIETQAQTITRLNRRDMAQERELRALRDIVGRAGIRATQRPKIE